MSMVEVPGSSGTRASLLIRLAQIIFSCTSLLFMSFDVQFYSYTAFCFLVTVMGLIIPWSFTLAVVDGYALMFGCPVRQSGILLVIVMGDWVCLSVLIHKTRSYLSVLSLAAACATAGVVNLLPDIPVNEGSLCPPKVCSRYQFSAIMAFLSWFLTAVSSLINLWLLPSLRFP